MGADMKSRSWKGFNFDFSYFLQTDSGGEIEIIISVENYTFPDPGRVFGPPEKCYPPEGSDWDISHMYVKDRNGKLVELPGAFENQLMIAIGADKLDEMVDEYAYDKQQSDEADYGDRKYDEMIDDELMRGKQ
jgi:hypothetical protein